MFDKFSELVKVVKGVSPSSDVYNGNPTSDAVNMENYSRLVGVLHQKTAGTNTGTATITCRASSDASGTGATAIPFTYRKIPTGASDTLGAETAATASGFTTTANEDTAYLLEVEAASLPSGKPFVDFVLTETVNDPVIGGLMMYLYGARYMGATLPTGIA